jgi:D-aspartate ligase
VRAVYDCPDPSEDEEGFIAGLLALERRWEGAVLFPTDDGSLVAISRHATTLARRYRTVPEPWHVVSQLIEKHHTYDIAHAHGVPCPRLELAGSTRDCLEFAAQIGFPCLLKPSVGHLFFKRHRKKMFMVHSESELREQLAIANEYDAQIMLSEFIPGGDECGANYNSFAVDGQPVSEFTATKIRNKPRLIGFPTVVRSTAIPEVQALGRTMLQALKLSDFSCMEFKRDIRDGSYKLMEVNARHNCSGALALACGIEFPYLSYKRALGEALPEMPRQAEEVYWIDEEHDARDVLTALRRGGERARQALAPYRARKVFAVSRIDDPLPTLRLLGASLSFALARRDSTRSATGIVKTS